METCILINPLTISNNKRNMKIVFTLEEVKNMICVFTQESVGGESKPKEVRFVIRPGSESRELEEYVEVIY